MTATTDGSSSRPHVMMLGLRSLGSGQGGVEAHVEQLASELDARGCRVEVVVRKPYSGAEVRHKGKATRIVPLWSPSGQSSEAIVHSVLGVFYAARRRPHALHIHAVGPALVAPLARILGLRVIFTHHGEDYNREKWGKAARFVLRMGEKLGTSFSNRRICVSPSLSQSLTKAYGKVYDYVPNGVRRAVRAETTDTLDSLGLTPGGYIVHVGRIVPEKRQLDLVAMMARLGRPGMKLALVGAADHNSEYSAEVLKQAAENPDIVLCGFQTGNALAELFSQCALFALPSSHEGLPIALLEAMSYGCPVVVSDIEANLNVALPAECYFPMGDQDALLERVRAALAGPGRVDWSETLAQFDWQKIADKTLNIYKEAGVPVGG
ncbi:MAG: glycosyltransferase [Sphingobium sp.]|nr:glycosyltransferase [Sphingobium sp.]